MGQRWMLLDVPQGQSQEGRVCVSEGGLVMMKQNQPKPPLSYFGFVPQSQRCVFTGSLAFLLPLVVHTLAMHISSQYINQASFPIPGR